ncbi:type II secretion system inner membrane protein GspF [Luteimonas sp. MC1750]|uniref:type II secretion system inner membrane protein GspF n=1 Tax=Luteimonas sp. MC1750 TaxID=2799326 RepID=UPI0018F08A3E|nr:type II secretion system inner membrane protein GspF [Luteimonas sp. MC1750]MBJ6983909.1 type II secretion system inner membrane protein GspF [Luteimonas sp. MC1750]QQO06727.1 type II secretion system inner membrane protein GspF [Luteimonas sp. MC1750]
MAAFEYSALDMQGRSRDGVIDAGNAAEARRLLEGRRLLPVRVEPATVRAEQVSRGGGRFRARDLTLLTRQLATLVAVAPLEEALRTIGSQSERPAVRRVVMATHARVVEGFRLSDAMAREPRAFPPLYRAMVAAGEGTGALPAILERLADLHERDQQVRGKLVSALVYPAALAVTAVLVVIALMVFVVPKVVEQFESMGRELPLLTRIVIGFSELLSTWWLPMAVLLAAAAITASRLLRRPALRRRFDAALLRLPLLGRLLRDVHAARMARTLATMSDSGLPLIEGLAITARTVGNSVLREATESMVEVIREGGSLSGAMKRAAVFPPTLLYMATSGEDSGRLAPMLDRAADYLEREFNTFTTAAMSLLEPLIIIVLGAMVAVIVLAILLPILQFNALVAG